MPISSEERQAAHNFMVAFNLDQKVNLDEVAKALFSQKQMIDVNHSRDYLDQFFKKCARRDPNATKTFQRQTDAIINGSEKITVLMDFVVRCRQSHLFKSDSVPPPVNHNNDSASINDRTSSTAQSSPFQRRSASRTRVLSTLTGDPIANESTRSRANSSFTSYDSRYMGGSSSQHLGMERSNGSGRPKSPFRIMTSGGKKPIQTTPLSASNHLFSQSNGYGSPSSIYQNQRPRDGSPSVLRHTPGSIGSTQNVNESIRSHRMTTTPIHSRIGSALCETESIVCECVCSALLGIESRLFRSDGNRKMIITSTASLTTTHIALTQRILSVANNYLVLAHREAFGTKTIKPITEAMLAAIRFILGEYTSDIDLLRRTKNLKFVHILPIIDAWQTKLNFLLKCHSFRKMEQLDLLESIYMLRCYISIDEQEKYVYDLLFEYTMGVFCKQMIEWMMTGEIPTEKWIIDRNIENNQLEIKRIPIFMNQNNVRILLEIGKALPHIRSTSHENLETIDQATSIVAIGLTPKLIMNNEHTNLLKGLRDVVCGIVMTTVLKSGKLKEHLRRATSLFFLINPRFTETMYQYMKDASMGLRVGTASLSKQQVSAAFGLALSVTHQHEEEKKEFRLDAITSLGNTPNVSSRMQFVQPLRPKYVPVMEAMQPIFSSCDDYYENIFHVIWAIDLGRLSSQEVSNMIPPMFRYLEKNITLRENALGLLKMISHLFFVINSTLSRVRNTIAIQVNVQFNRFLAAIDESCVDVDDVIEEHLKFAKRAAISVYLVENELIEQQLAAFLQTVFEAQDLIKDFGKTWEEIIEISNGDMNILKAKMAESCKKRVIPVRMIMDKINAIQKKLVDELDHQAVFGNDALVE